MESSASLILANARVLTLDPLNPRAKAVAIAGDRIAAVGSKAQVSSLRGPKTEVIDCRGLPLIPGLNDAHTHILATAASLSVLDCGPPDISSIGELLAAIRERAAVLPVGQWIRGIGLEPGDLRENRYPTLKELDSATAQHPVRLEHSSGHACLLNSSALIAAGIDAATPDPPEGVIERYEKGRPTGLLLEMGGYLRERLGRTRSPEEMAASVSLLSMTLLSYGITSVQDAGPDNGIDQWDTLKYLTSTQVFQPRVTMMAGAGKLHEMAEAGLGWGSGDDRLRIGHAKIMLTRTTGQLMPARQDLAELGVGARKLGFPIAIHAIEQEAVEAAVHAVTLADLVNCEVEGRFSRSGGQSSIKESHRALRRVSTAADGEAGPIRGDGGYSARLHILARRRLPGTGPRRPSALSLSPQQDGGASNTSGLWLGLAGD